MKYIITWAVMSITIQDYSFYKEDEFGRDKLNKGYDTIIVFNNPHKFETNDKDSFYVFLTALNKAKKENNFIFGHGKYDNEIENISYITPTYSVCETFQWKDKTDKSYVTRNSGYIYIGYLRFYIQ